MQEEKNPDRRKASTRKVIAAEVRPRINRHGRCQTSLQSEQARYLASCERYATLEPDGLGRRNRMDLKSEFPRSVEFMWTTVDIYYKESSFIMGQGPCADPVSLSSYSKSEFSVLPRYR